MNIASAIRAVRLSKGLSQGDIENRCGLLRHNISVWECGRVKPSLPSLQILADAMDFPVAQFFAPDPLAEPLSDEAISTLHKVKRYTDGMSVDQLSAVLAAAKKFAAHGVMVAAPREGS